MIKKIVNWIKNFFEERKKKKKLKQKIKDIDKNDPFTTNYPLY